MKFLSCFLLVLWQLPQYLTSIFFEIYLYFKKYTVYVEYRDAMFVNVVITGKRGLRGVSFGKYIYIMVPYETTRYEDILQHELGHSRQSLYLGWLYLIVVGLPSIIVTSVNPRLAKRLWVERWADKLSKN